MTYLGDIAPSSIIDLKFTTVNTSGVPTQLAGTPAISVYKDNSVTQSTTGVTLTVDFDSVTGLNNVRVDTSADGTFYAAGSNFQVVITTGTVSGASVVGYVVGQFSIHNRSSLRPTTAGRTLDVSATGEAGLDWANIGSPTTTQTLSGTTVKTATDVETDTADIQTRLPAALVGGRIDSNVGAISGDATAADNEEAFFDGTGYAGTGNTIPTVTTVNGLAANTITATSIAADAITAAKIATGAFDADALATDAAGEIADAVWDEAASGHVSSGSFGQAQNLIRANTAQAGASSSITLDASASAVDDFYNNTIIFVTGGTGSGQSKIISDYVGSTKVATVSSAWATTPSSDSVFVILPFGSIPGATAPTAGEVADAVWDEATSGHTTSGTFGEQAKTDIDAILADTGTDGVVVASINAGAINATAVADSTIDAATIATDAKSRILKNSALANFMFFMTDSLDHVSAKTGLTITATRSLDGAAFAACTNSATEVSAGMYKIDLAAGDLNANVVTLRFTGSGADDRLVTIVTQQA